MSEEDVSIEGIAEIYGLPDEPRRIVTTVGCLRRILFELPQEVLDEIRMVLEAPHDDATAVQITEKGVRILSWVTIDE